MPAAIDPWPYPGTTPLTYIFVGSILAAAAASTLWATVSGNFGALAGVFLDYVAILTPVSLLAFRLRADISAFAMAAIACPVIALLGLALLIWSVRIPLDPTRPM